MISKTRKNRKNKISNRRNEISKTRKISGGGEIFSWNLGPLILKKEKGLFSDKYWIEYPTDPIENGWTQIEPTPEDPVPKYTCSETVKPPKEEYTWSNLHFQNSIMEKSIFVRPLPDGSFEKSTCHDGYKYCLFDENEHNKKLSEQTWKNSKRIPINIGDGLKNFIRSFYNKETDFKSMKIKWIVNPLKKNLLTILKGLIFHSAKFVRSEFMDLYKSSDWDIKTL
jgi:hypothetical protein